MNSRGRQHSLDRGLRPAPQRLGGREKVFSEKSAYPIDKSRFGRENPRKSKRIQGSSARLSQRGGHEPRNPKSADEPRRRPRRRRLGKFNVQNTFKALTSDRARPSRAPS